MDEAAFERQLQFMLNHRAPPLSGWVLQMALQADEDTGYPVVVSLHKATDFRRAVVVAVLATLSVEGVRTAFGAENLVHAMHLLFHANIRTVLRDSFGAVPGLATVLGKTQGEPFEDPGHYDVMLTLLQPSADPYRRKRTLALRHADNITSGVVCALERLDGELVHPLLVRLFDGEASADTANAILRYAQTLSSTAVTLDDILVISKGLQSLIFREWAEKLFARKADRLPAGPLDDHSAFVALKDATSFMRIARDYRNCLDTHVLRAATGRSAFYIANQSPNLIVELRRHRYAGRDIWALHDVHAHCNRSVAPRDRKHVEDLLRVRGITELALGHDDRITAQLASVLSPDIGYDDNY